MADRLWRVMATINHGSAVPEDATVNVWHFDDDDDPLAAPEDTGGWISDLLQTFYTAVGNALFPSTIAGTIDLKMYDMAEPAPRVPVFTDQLTAPGHPSEIGLPGEVALCLSAAAAFESGVPNARRRGRVFLGPIRTGAAESVVGQSRPTSAARTAVATAAGNLRDGFEHPASPGLRLHWSIYSPKTDETLTIGEAFNDVLTGWVDNAWDTQRRRGPVATTRNTF